jgi:hypothetical protein
MKRPWKKGASSQRVASGLGLESIRFNTLGLTRQPDEELNERYWLGPNLMLSENFFPIPPDFPSLQEDEIRTTYQAWLGGQRPDAEGRTSRLLHLSVDREMPVPAIFTMMRTVVPGNDRYSFVGAITLPLAECSWVIKVQSDEGPTTGIRETLAGARFRREIRHLPENEQPSFDPYEEQWDLDEGDPLSEVRQSMKMVLESLEVGPEVREAKPFRP